MMNNLKICYQSVDNSQTLDKYKINDRVISVFSTFLDIIKCIMQLKIYKKQPKDGRVQLVESYIIYA